jgi:ribose 5-phosphate isomerase B
MAKTILIANDHAGTELKKKIVIHLKNKGLDIINFGTDTEESVDYPDFIHPLCKELEKENREIGIIICGSGNGVSMVANKYAYVRAALCWNKEIAILARKHNNANIIALPARFLKTAEVIEILDVFLQTSFEGGRHQKRIEKIPK